MIEIEKRRQWLEEDVVDVGSGLLVFRTFRARVASEADLAWTDDPSAALEIEATWSSETSSYEVTSLRLTGEAAISSTSLRAIPLTGVLRACLSQVDVMRVGGSGEAYFLVVDDVMRTHAATLGRRGPTPEALEWVARYHRLARVRLQPPTQFISELFELPHRTASHWIKLAKDRGHLIDETAV